MVVYHPLASVEDPQIQQLKEEVKKLKNHNMGDIK